MTGRSPIRFRTTRLACLVAGTGLLVVAVVVIGAMAPGYDPMTDTVSRLGSPGQPYAIWARTAFVLYGLLVLGGAAPLGDVAPTRRRSLTTAIAIYAAAAVVAGLARKDPPDVPSTFVSEVHVGATIVGGAGILFAMILVSRHAPLRVDRRLATVVAALTTVGVVVFRFSWGSALYGLIERSFLALAMLWLAALAARLLTQDRVRVVLGEQS